MFFQHFKKCISVSLGSPREKKISRERDFRTVLGHTQTQRFIIMSYLLVVMYLVRTVLRMWDMLFFNFSIKLQLSVQVLTYFLFAGSVIILVYYVRLTIQQNLIANRSFSSAEWKCILYLSVLVIYFICIIIVGGNAQILNS